MLGYVMLGFKWGSLGYIHVVVYNAMEELERKMHCLKFSHCESQNLS